MNQAISANGVGKQYRIGARERAGRTLREALVDVAVAPIRRLGRIGQPPRPEELIWALKDVSFDVQPGEVVGVIGRNGAGKSTLLKILSRITEPTKGRIELRGRVASLLEVGTGFHPELTGRENVYLNGTILGMKKAEIDRKFDEIVAFAEIGRFLDTTVKHYSSGMYVRLAFAVAAHLEPEILLVDEVLAVGDASFQKKCLGKMGEVAKAGRTVLFVSHNMAAVRNLCGRTIWLEEGRIFDQGDTPALTEHYLQRTIRGESPADLAGLIKRLPADPAFRLTSVDVRQNNRTGMIVLNGRPVEIEMRYSVRLRTTGLRVYFDLLDEDQNILIRSFHDDAADAMSTMEPGDYVSTAVIPADLLAPRTYEIRIHAGIFNVRSCTGEGVGVSLTVEQTGGINRGYPHDPIRSKLLPRIPWRTCEAEQKALNRNGGASR
jgi:lipopolysaccharide transport system ATP-binding protein